jgi:hypothetical protein
MNQDQILGIVRHVLTFGGGYLVAKGIVDEATMLNVVGAAVTIIGAVWSIAQKKVA